MLSKDARIARYLFALIFYLLSGLQILTGEYAALSGTAGTVCLASALLGYSPIIDYYENVMEHRQKRK